MNQLAFFRTFLLVMSVLALLTATVLDGITMRYLTRPFVRRFDELSGGKAQFPPGMRYIMEHEWARRLYHLLFAVLALGAWWYLGTPAGMALFRPHR